MTETGGPGPPQNSPTVEPQIKNNKCQPDGSHVTVLNIDLDFVDFGIPDFPGGPLFTFQRVGCFAPHRLEGQLAPRGPRDPPRRRKDRQLEKQQNRKPTTAPPFYTYSAGPMVSERWRSSVPVATCVLPHTTSGTWSQGQPPLSHRYPCPTDPSRTSDPAKSYHDVWT